MHVIESFNHLEYNVADLFPFQFAIRRRLDDFMKILLHEFEYEKHLGFVFKRIEETNDVWMSLHKLENGDFALCNFLGL